jgi:hypothetical protein
MIHTKRADKSRMFRFTRYPMIAPASSGESEADSLIGLGKKNPKIHSGLSLGPPAASGTAKMTDIWNQHHKKDYPLMSCVLPFDQGAGHAPAGLSLRKLLSKGYFNHFQFR